MKKNLEEICRKYFKELTISHAIPRINEHLVLSQFNFKHPVLDIGCGEGAFAKILFKNKKIDVGLDIDRKPALLAEKSGIYKKVVVSPANNIPYKDGYFETIISNSVLEHIDDLDVVFKEAYRVLKKGGRFIFLVPDKSASDYFFYAELLEKIKLKKMAKTYINLKNKLYRYAHLEDKKFWEETSLKNGFNIIKTTGLISPQTVRLIDFFSPTALPDYILRRIFGRSFIYRPDFIAKIIAFAVQSCFKPVKESEATAWCFELEKV